MIFKVIICFSSKWDNLSQINENIRTWFKAWLVDKDCTKQEGIDYHAIFILGTKHATVTVIALVISYSWFLKQLHVLNAFLHGTLEDEVHVSQLLVQGSYPTCFDNNTLKLFGTNILIKYFFMYNIFKSNFQV